jgi:hypothetical protein
LKDLRKSKLSNTDSSYQLVAVGLLFYSFAFVIHLVTKIHITLTIKHKIINLTVCSGLFCNRNGTHNFKKKARPLY